MGLNFKKDLTKAQYAAVTHKHGPAMVASTVGSGKCVTADTLVPTNKGLIYIDQIPNYFQVGDQGNCSATVAGITTKGVKRQKTSHWFDMGTARTIEIQTDSGLQIRGTYEHPLLILQSSDGEFSFTQLNKIQVGDIVVTSLGTNLWGTTEIDPDLAYIMGLLIGDGSLSLKEGIFGSGGLCKNRMAAMFISVLIDRSKYHKVKKYLQLNGDLFMTHSPFRYVPSSILQSNRGF